jgi:hypothetical protein
MTKGKAPTGRPALEVCLEGKKGRKRMRTTMFFWLVSSLALSLWGQDGASQAQGQAAPAAAAKGKGKAQAPPPAKPLSPEDAEIQRLQDERKRLLKQKEIEKLRKENEQLEDGAEKPAVVQAPPAKVLSPEDAELQHLEEERKRLLKEQEIEKLRKQNDALKAPPPPPIPAQPPAQAQAVIPPAKPCPSQTQQGPKLSVRTPPKASAWACQHLGVCTDNRPAPQNDDSGAPLGRRFRPLVMDQHRPGLFRDAGAQLL